MKKTELFTVAMNAVLDSGYTNGVKLEVLALLLEEQSLAAYTEKEAEAQK